MELELELTHEKTAEVLTESALKRIISRKMEGLERKVFVFKSSEKDRKLFLTEMANWLKNEQEVEGEYKSFTQLLWHITWLANENGKYIKYLYFNERSQKLYLDRDFFEWAKLGIDEVENNLKKAYG